MSARTVSKTAALINAKADVNVRNELGYSALMIATRATHANVARQLIEAGALRN